MLPPSGPLRRMALGTLVNNLGNGAWFTTWAIFFTRSARLSPAVVGVGMTVAGLGGMLLSTPVGHLADRLGAREVFTGLLLVQAAGTVAFAFVHSAASFLPVACVTLAASQTAGGPRGALVCGLTHGDERVNAMASLRSISHVGTALGAVAGGVVLALDVRAGYLGMLGFDAATYLAYAAIVAGMPRVATVPRGDGPRFTVLRDRPYVTLAALVGVLTLSWGMLSTALPLWVVGFTHAPHAMSAVVIVLSSLAIAAFQLPVSRGFREPIPAARGALWSGAALAASCVVFALTYRQGGALVVALLLIAAVLHIAGEVLFVAASWGLSIPLMPADAQGEYQGMFATGEATALMAAPALMTTLIAGWGQPGWLVLGAIFVLATAPAMPVTRWALRTRTA